MLMKNNKGFLSISVVYSFFIVFLALLLFIVSSYINNRTLLNKVKNDIKEEAELVTNKSFVDFITQDLYSTNGTNDLYFHSSSLDKSAGDNSYRFSGVNPNNYVCFGYTDASICNSTNNADYLYRIIGVFNVLAKDNDTDASNTKQLVKLVKNAYYTTNTYNWNEDTNVNNDWNTSDINLRTLNNVYLLNLGSWADYIAIPTWIVGGNINTYITSSYSNTVYTREVSNPAIYNTSNNKIGLMYVSDYLYATNSIYWTTTNTIKKNENYLSIAENEWFITRDSNTTNNVFYKDSNGSIKSGSVIESYYVRPTFYLKSTIKVSTKHSGTQKDPYRIILEEGDSHE